MNLKKRFPINNIGALLFVMCLSVSCSSSDKDPEVDPVTPVVDEPTEPSTTASATSIAMNEWMLSKMQDKYLWQDDIPSDLSTDTDDTQAFFESMLSQNDGKHTNGADYFYSYLEEDPEYTATRALQSGDTYGLFLTWYRLTDEDGVSTDNLAARVLYVAENSSAAEAGVERGDWIWFTDQSGERKDITSSDLLSFYSGSGFGFYTIKNGEEITAANLKLVTISASKQMELSPIFKSEVVEQGGKKVGYICYNAFVSGVTPFETFEYDDALIAIFNDFKSQQIDDLVLDLRYNGGGDLRTAGLLAYMLAPQADLDQPIWILTDYDGAKDSYTLSSFRNRYKDSKFDQTLDLPNLDLSHLYCIVSAYTASASEAVANGLKPYMDVTLIGSTTEGKDVGMERIRDSNNKYPYYMWPITFRITSTDTSFHYSDGLVPDTANTLDEKYVVDSSGNSSDIEMLPLGDRGEALFAHALSLIADTPSTRAVKTIRTYGTVGVEVPAYGTLTKRPWYETNALIIPAESVEEAN